MSHAQHLPKSHVVAIAWIVAAALLTNAASAQQQTPSGFYFPTGTSNIGDYASFLALGCNGASAYITDQYHLGKDIRANLGDTVYAIADGIVVRRSESGWGTGNIGLVVRHTLSNGMRFQAVYGHIVSGLREGAEVVAGRSIGSVGYTDPVHLHFGIRLDANPDAIPTAPYGKGECWQWPAVNQFIDPLPWITSQRPAPFRNGGNQGSGQTQDQLAIADIERRAATDRRFLSSIAGSFGFDPNWGSDTPGYLKGLRWLDYNFSGGRRVRIFHSTPNNVSGIRYTIFFDPDRNDWTGWQLVQ